MPSPGHTGPRASFVGLKGKGRQHSDSPAESRSWGPGAETTPSPPSQSSNEGAARREEVREAEQEEGAQLGLLNHTTSLGLDQSQEQSGPREGVGAMGGSGGPLRGSGRA